MSKQPPPSDDPVRLMHRLRTYGEKLKFAMPDEQAATESAAVCEQRVSAETERAKKEIAWLRRMITWCHARLKPGPYQTTLNLYMAKGPTEPDDAKIVHSDSAPAERPAPERPLKALPELEPACVITIELHADEAERAPEIYDATEALLDRMGQIGLLSMQGISRKDFVSSVPSDRAATGEQPGCDEQNQRERLRPLEEGSHAAGRGAAQAAPAPTINLPELDGEWDYKGDDPAWQILYRWLKHYQNHPQLGAKIGALFIRGDGGGLHRLAGAINARFQIPADPQPETTAARHDNLELGWCPKHHVYHRNFKCEHGFGSSSPAAVVDYTERSREIAHWWFGPAPAEHDHEIVGRIAAALSTLASEHRAEIAALKHDIARYQAAASSEAEAHSALLARLREPDEELVEAVALAMAPALGWPHFSDPVRNAYRRDARAALTKITEMLTP